MPRSNRLDQAINLLTGLIQSDSFTLPATNGVVAGRVSAADLGKGLEGIVKSLPDQELRLTSPAGKSDPDDESKWSLEGAPAGEWPVPGFPKTTLEISGSKATLKVTDKGNDKDCEYELGFSGKIEIGVSCPVAVTLSEKGKFKVVVGDAKGKADLIKIDPVSLSEKFYIPGLSDTLRAISKLVRLDAVALMSTTVSGTIDAETKEATVTSIMIVGSVTFAGVGVQMQVSVAQGADQKLDRSHPSVAITWPSADDPDGGKKSITLGAILKELGAGFTLPSKLDVPFRSFTLEHKWIAEKDQLNKNDTRRIQLQAPSGKNPDLLIVGSFDENDKKRVTARLGWGKLSLKQLPMAGDHLPGEFEPLFLLMTSQNITIKDIGKLCSMKDFDLETLGTPEDKLEKAPPLGGGIHVTGIFSVSDVVEVPFHFPLFAKKTKKPDLLTDGDEDEALVENEEPTPVQIQRSVGPVSLQSLTFKFEKKEKISILLNLALKASELTIELLGLRASFSISDRSLSFGIDGGIITYSSNTVQIGGGFVRDTSGLATDWIGTALVRVGEAFSLNAAVAFSDGDPKKLFIFAYTHRQLGGPPYFYVTGLAGGFGYNRSFIAPAVDQVNKFPMIAMANTLSRGGDAGLPEKFDSSAMWKIVSGIGKYLPPDPSGTMFGAFGITFTSFGYIKSTLLAAMLWGSNRRFVLLGSSVIDAPKETPVAHVDLQVVATADSDQLKVDGALGPESYILDRKCRLTGGFAVYCWFTGKNSGDLVITIGGYHPAYTKPDHYPDVPRLGFLWKVGSDTQITGFAYFAFTPKSIQVGGGLDFVIDADPLRVWFHAEAHFWVNWLPFYYNIRASVDFGVSFRMDLLFCSVTITVDISADLKMWGPSFTGHADVHLWFASFSTNFGAGASQELPKAGWPNFVTTFVNPASPKAMLGADSTSCLEVVPVGGLMIAAAGTVINGGAFNGESLDWFADPQQLRLTIATTVPAQNAWFNDANVDPKQTIAIYARPVTNEAQVTSPRIDPALKVTLKHESGKPIRVEATAVTDLFAAAMWGPPSDASAGKEMIAGIKGVALAPTPALPSRSVAIDMDVLLFAGTQPINVTWERPAIPSSTFDWATHNPFLTINAQPARDARGTMVKDLLSLGYLQESAAAIDVSNVKIEQPCFMEHPRLCRMGTDQTGA